MYEDFYILHVFVVYGSLKLMKKERLTLKQ